MQHRENYRSLELHNYEMIQQRYNKHVLTCVCEYLSG